MPVAAANGASRDLDDEFKTISVDRGPMTVAGDIIAPASPTLCINACLIGLCFSGRLS